MGNKVLHQVVEAMSVGDATSDHAFLIRGWLRELGFETEIYAAGCQKELESEVRPFSATALKNQELVIFHHTIGSAILDELIALQVPLLLIYHNITPPAFFAVSDPALARRLEAGRQQLARVRPFTRLALGASPYSELELIAEGFSNTGVLPIVIYEADYDLPSDPELLAALTDGPPLLLFVGRVVPNKCQEDLLKLLHYVRRYEPGARLALVGGTGERAYVNWLRYFTGRLGLTGAVMLTGKVTQRELVTYYRAADLFVSMSEHEGFGKPLIESMYFDLPVLAYAAAAVPSTLGEAGVLFTEKDYESLAEIAGLLLNDQPLREQVLSAQRRRVQTFLQPQVRAQFINYLAGLRLL